MSGLDDEQILLIFADGDAIGEVQALHNYSGLFRRRRVFEDSAVSAVFKNIEQTRFVRPA